MTIPKEIVCWQMARPNEPLVKASVPVPSMGANDVLVEVAGCGLCHTDLSFLYGGVRTKKDVPLTLGHEISGTVIAHGGAHETLVGKTVIIPAVLPCGTCELCKAGKGTACRNQIMPGNDLNGGFATHLVVPGNFLCEVRPGDFELWELGIVADAVTTPYQATERANVREGDVVIVIGTGGIGTYGVQVSAARGAKVIAVDVDQQKLDRIKGFGASAIVNVHGMDVRSVRDAVRGAAKDLHVSKFMWKVFEMSGTGAGQAAAYELLTFGGTIGFIGFTMDKTPVRLGNLMAFDATIFGNWGCLPELYRPAVDLVLTGKVKTRPFTKRFALDDINDVIAAARNHEITERPVLVP